jgi:hypothetical protein
VCQILSVCRLGAGAAFPEPLVNGANRQVDSRLPSSVLSVRREAEAGTAGAWGPQACVSSVYGCGSRNQIRRPTGAGHQRALSAPISSFWTLPSQPSALEADHTNKILSLHLLFSIGWWGLEGRRRVRPDYGSFSLAVSLY